MSDLIAALQGLREKALKATPGPWYINRSGEPDPGGYYGICAVQPDTDITTRFVRSKGPGRPWQGTLDYLAACSPEVVLALIAVTEAAYGLYRVNGNREQMASWTDMQAALDVLAKAVAQ